MPHSPKFVGRFVVLGTIIALAACQDASQTPTAPVTPQTPQPSRSPVAQARLEAIFQSASPEVMSLPGTVFADNDEVAGRLVFGVENPAAINGVRHALARLGVDESDYSIEITKPIVMAATLRDNFGSKVGGIQIHFSRYLCTLGFNVDHSDGRSFITNSHCTATQGGTEGTQYYQPSSNVNGTVIATEADDPVYVKNAAGCPRGKKCRSSDASRALYSDNVSSSLGVIAKTTGPNNGSLTTAGEFTVTSQDNTTTSFALGTVVNKVGRTTGWTQGPIFRTCAGTNVSGSTVHLRCQSFVTAGVGGGDSGSPVFSITSSSNVRLVGILWGGASDGSYFVFSPLAAIRSELGSVTATQ